MQDKTTGDLKREMGEQPNLDAYLRENGSQFVDRSIGDLLDALYETKAVSKASLARRAGMSEVYLHQVFSGRRKPSRDRLLCICIGLGATLEETQRLLKRAAYAALYPRIRRDAISSHGIVHRMELEEINETLFLKNEKALF